MKVNYYKLDELVFNFCCEYVKLKILILILILDKLMGSSNKENPNLFKSKTRIGFYQITNDLFLSGF